MLSQICVSKGVLKRDRNRRNLEARKRCLTYVSVPSRLGAGGNVYETYFVEFVLPAVTVPELSGPVALGREAVDVSFDVHTSRTHF